jgi:hypothetical protein
MIKTRSASSIKRTFRDLSDKEVADIESASALVRMGWSGGVGWDELVRSYRVLIVSEAGVGKTYECREQQKKLWAAGEPAFFLDLATLAVNSVREMLGNEEEQRFDAWLRSQSDVATFFLDSYDELRLTLGKFEQALKRLNKALQGQLARARIVVTTRPVPMDRELLITHLPIPQPREAQPTAEAFADMVMGRERSPASKEVKPKAWRNVGLMPLSREQIREFAIAEHVDDPDALLADIRKRDTEEFAGRPQDLIELCADWREHHRIRAHQEQVEANIATKLKPNTERKERAELSQQRAYEGASRIALAAMLTRKLTLRHSAEADRVAASEAALDVSKILSDWGADEQATLLERPLFGFASYGRVRFHHRSVVEFLAAKRLHALLAKGTPVSAIKRLLLTETAQGTEVVRPSMRPVAAWLALWCDSLFTTLVAIDPATLLDHGDPQSLRPAQRISALEAYIERYGSGGWRGLSVPRIHVYRFASSELAETVQRRWNEGIENHEVRDLLLQLIGAGKLRGCSDIAYAVLVDSQHSLHERAYAVEALLQLEDPRIETLATSIENDRVTWPDPVARQITVELFPRHLPVQNLLAILQKVMDNPKHIGDWVYRLPHAIENEDIAIDYLDRLRRGLTDLVREDASWKPDQFPHLRTTRPDLIKALLAACYRQCQQGVRSEAWVGSALLAIRLSHREHGEEKAIAALKGALAELPPIERERAFWKDDAFLSTLHVSKDAWNRVFDLSQYSGIQLNDAQDAAWVRRRLSDSSEALENREMMLWAEMILLNRDVPDQRLLLEGLRLLVSDAPTLAAIIDNRLKPTSVSAELRRMEAENQKRKQHSDRRAAKAHASWVMFWREIAQKPEKVFAPDRADNTAWNLWDAVARSGVESRASGWNRRFIEAQFGRDVADRLRQTMMAAWRKDKPTLRSERSEGEKDTFLVRWQFGLAGIAAEAEDPNWAKRLSEQEAELACRYAPIELSGFPSWLESLAVEFPAVIDRVLGNELSVSLHDTISTNAYSMFLQNISHASPIISALFIPRIRSWLQEISEIKAEPNAANADQNVRQAVEILVKNGNDDDRRLVESVARKRLEKGLRAPFGRVWLSALLYLNPADGVNTVEAGLRESAASKTGEGVQWFATLFGRDSGGIAINLAAPAFTPALLLKLVRLAYQHVRITDDVRHEGSYSPDTRDHAEQGRSAVLSALLATTGTDGWEAKLAMAADPLFAHFKDRAIALAEERAAEEADATALSEAEFAVLDQTGEAPPATTEDMYALMRDRLDDLDDLLLQDISPRELWASIGEEHLMRRELARFLRDAAKQSYIVDQEAVTADEKETDIRLRSTASGQQGTIELKLGDNRTANDLLKTLNNQLLTKYMASDDCRAGCLLVTIAKQREWQHPFTGQRIGFVELIVLLSDEAARLSRELGGMAKLMAKGLDLRPRLETEKNRMRAA